MDSLLKRPFSIFIVIPQAWERCQFVVSGHHELPRVGFSFKRNWTGVTRIRLTVYGALFISKTRNETNPMRPVPSLTRIRAVSKVDSFAEPRNFILNYQFWSMDDQ